jgi:hypothetical protein
MGKALDIIASVLGSPVANKLIKHLLRGESLDQITIDRFFTKAQKRKIGMLLAVERGEEMMDRIEENKQ